MNTSRRSFLIAAGAVPLAYLYGGPAWSQSVDEAKLLKPGPLGEMVLGDDNAPVTIIEYASATCPHCATFHEDTFKTLKEKYINTGKVRFLFREFPLDDASLAAFMLARCTPGNKYFPMIEIIFQQQKIWGVPGADIYAGLFNIARLAGFTNKTFNECLANEEVAKGILEVQKLGAELGVKSTPSFFVNGELTEGGGGIAKFEALIKPHLSN